MDGCQGLIHIDKAEVARDAYEKGAVNIQLDVREGRILAVIMGQNNASKYEVKTPYGVCGARGENTSIEVGHDGSFRCIQGMLVGVYVMPIDLVPALRLNNGMQSVPPKAGESRYEQTRIDDAVLNRISAELKQLKESAASSEKKADKLP